MNLHILNFMKKIHFLFLIFFIFPSKAYLYESKILFKLPTRERSHKIFKLLDEYYHKLSGQGDVNFLLSCDIDDVTMNNPEVIEQLRKYENLSIYFSNNKNKIEACNANMDMDSESDIIVLISDDMTPIVEGYDALIAEKMENYFPDYDGVINFNDGRVGDVLITCPIIGKKYYERFNYIYHPSYKTLCCDVELTIVAKKLKKYQYDDRILIRHDHFSYGFPKDNLDVKNNDLSLSKADRELLEKRFFNCFDLENLGLEYEPIFSTKDLWPYPKGHLFSILIPTLENRKFLFEPLYRKLLSQIYAHPEKVELLFFRDSKKFSVGYKRNNLKDYAIGKYIAFVDDDDDIHPEYCKIILKNLETDPDVVSLIGIMTTDGKNPQKFIHSIKFKNWFEKRNIFYRPPNHLNPIRKSIADKFPFPEKNIGEDFDWSMKISKSGLLKKESECNVPYYFYKFCSRKK